MSSLYNRRQFIQFISSQTTALSLSPLLLQGLSACSTTDEIDPLKGIKPSFADKLLLAPGLSYHIICKSGTPINKAGEKFGTDNDFTSFLPMKGKTDEGLLWVNHESVTPQFLHNKQTKDLSRSINEMMAEQESVGGSILHIKRLNGKWMIQKDSPYNRRLHGRTKIPFSNNAKIQGTNTAVGTIANCSGGQTPWGTFLTSEENYDGFYGEAFIVNGKREVRTFDRFNWWKHFPLPPEHYGWIVEIDPLTGKAEKQVLLGRAPHEGAKVVVTKQNRIAVYMGEDREGGYIYKFVSDGMHFQSGTLYAADTIKGRWLPLDIQKSPQLKKVFKNQLEVLTYAHQSAETVGATPQDRPEGIEVHKQTGDVFISLTKNSKRGNLYGSILKISGHNDHIGMEFTTSTWVSGGPESGIACPDNLCFDKKGNLWVTNDVSEKAIGSKKYGQFGNNGLFCVPMSGPKAGVPIQIASAPKDAELTGPWFTPNCDTLFLSVQHPGVQTRKNLLKPTSTWPDGPGQLPKSSVVAIQGDLFQQLMK